MEGCLQARAGDGLGFVFREREGGREGGSEGERETERARVSVAVPVCVCLSVCVYIYIYICMYICVCLDTYAGMFIHVYGFKLMVLGTQVCGFSFTLGICCRASHCLM